jgi:DNA repair protein RadC
MRLNEIEVTYKAEPTGVFIKTPEEAADYLRELWPKDIQLRESFIVLFLSASKQVIGHNILSTGSRTATIADPAMIFSIALKVNSHSIIVSHNHPSGNKAFSQADIQLTKRLAEGGKILGVELVDHILLHEGHTSFREKGLL